MSTAAPPASGRTVPGTKQHLLDTFEREHEKTMRVLRAYPKEKWELRPHAMSKTARELAFAFFMEQKAMQTVMTTGFDFSKPPAWPAAPDSADAVLSALDAEHAKTGALLRGLRDE